MIIRFLKFLDRHFGIVENYNFVIFLLTMTLAAILWLIVSVLEKIDSFLDEGIPR